MTDIRHDERHDDPSAAQVERSRRAARRTALLLAGIVVVVYVGFLLIGILGA